MKLTFKSMMKNAFLALGFALLMAGCSFNSGAASEDKYNYTTPEFKTGDLYYLQTTTDGVSEYDNYCFESAAGGSVVVYTYTDSKYVINKYPLTYSSGESTVNGKPWLSFMMKDNSVMVFYRENCFKRTDGKKGLSGTFYLGSNSITFSKKGKGTAELNGHHFEITYTNDNGIVAISDKSSSLQFYYLSDGSLLPFSALSYLYTSEGMYFSVIMNAGTGSDGEAFIETMKDLPDGFYYQLSNKSKTTRADLATIKTILTQNPNKKFSISPGIVTGSTYTNGSSDISKIPENYFAGFENLYKFSMGYPSNFIQLETGAFKNCKNLKEIVNSDCISSFGESCFEGCSALEIIHISYDLKSKKETHIKPNAFKGCTSLNVSFNTNYTHVKVKKDGVDEIDIFSSEIQGQTDNLTNLLTTKYVDYEWTFATN